jgi:type I restriction enzyme S subunit
MTSWPFVKLGEVIRLDLDRVTVDPSVTYPMVGVYSFGRGLFHREAVEGGTTSYKHFYRLKADHIVMSQLFGWEGALALSTEEFADRFVSPQFPTFACESTKLDRRFLGWLMRRPVFWEDLGTRAAGMGDRRRTLNPESLFACQIPLPPLPEQRRIVVRIEELATKINEARGLRQQAAQEAEALVNAAMKTQFDFSEAETVVGDYAKVQGGYAFPSGEYNEFGTHQVVRIGNVRDGFLDLSRAPVRLTPGNDSRVLKYELCEGDLVISMTGTRNKRDYGFIGKVPAGEKLLLNQRVGRFVIRKEIERDYLFHFLRSPFFRDNLFPSATGTANQANVGNGDIECVGFAPPKSLPEQCRVVAELDALHTQVDALKKLQAETAAELEALLPSILDKAFRREL